MMMSEVTICGYVCLLLLRENGKLKIIRRSEIKQSLDNFPILFMLRSFYHFLSPSLMVDEC